MLKRILKTTKRLLKSKVNIKQNYLYNHIESYLHDLILMGVFNTIGEYFRENMGVLK